MESVQSDESDIYFPDDLLGIDEMPASPEDRISAGTIILFFVIAIG